MNTIHDELKVFCKDTEQEYEILYPKYKQTNNKIIVKLLLKTVICIEDGLAICFITQQV